MRNKPLTNTFGLAAALVLGAFLSGQPVANAQKGVASSTLDDILRQVSTYDGGIESASVWELRDYVRAHADDAAGRAKCETKLLAFLKTTATPSAKMAAARHLRTIAGDSAVPALQTLIVHERTSDLALYVLRQIPGAAADKALLQSLTQPKLPVATRTSVIAVIGDRGMANAVPALVSLTQSPELARAAATALGAIGNDKAAQALAAAYPTAAKDVKAPMAAAMLRCAEKAVAAQNPAVALKVYDALSADSSLPAPMRKPAVLGRLSLGDAEAATMLVSYLQGEDVEMQEAAIIKLADVIKPEAIGPVCELLPRLPAATQVKLVTALAAYPAKKVLPTILAAARSDAVDVRMAAFKSLELTGDPTAVSLLAQAAAASKGSEQAAARSALALLKGRAVDAELLSLVASESADDVRGELILAIAERRMFPAKAVVADAVASPSIKVRVQAMKALRVLGTYSDIPAVLDVLVKATDEGERAEAEGATAALSKKMARLEGSASAVTARLRAETDPEVRARLIAVLPLIGDPQTLPTLRRTLDAGNEETYDAAVRALCAWPSPAAREDVMRLARDARDETHRLLAIAGLVRLIGLERYRDRELAVADLRLAAAFAWRPEERRLVLSALPPFACQDGLDLAKSLLRDPAVKGEAQAAIDDITKRLEAAKKGTT